MGECFSGDGDIIANMLGAAAISVLGGWYMIHSGIGSGWRRHDDLVARLPSFWRGNSVGIGGLQGLDQTQELIDGAAVAHRIVDHCT